MPNKNKAVNGGDDVASAATPVTPMKTRRFVVSSSENAFVGGDGGGDLAIALTGLTGDDWNNFRTPITDPAVDSNVK